MRLAVKILMIIFSLFIISNGFGQDIPWRYKITGINHTIFIDSALTTDIEDFSGSGVLGVFYDSAGIDVCAGYVELNGSDDYLIAYGETMNDNGIVSGERMRFKLWDRENDCIYGSTVVEYRPTVESPNTGNFVTDGASNIVSIRAKAISVEYPVDVICPGDDIILPAVIDSGDHRLAYSANAGLNIDKNTGVIDAEGSQPGDYKIQVTSRYCISSPEIPIRISSYREPGIAEQQYKCPDAQLDVNSVISDAADNWRVPDSLNNSLDTGMNTIKLSNPDGCIVEKEVEIINYPEPEIQYETDYNCESTTIRLSEGQELTGIKWPDEATGNSIEVYENSNIELRYTDTNQCGRIKSIDVTVKKLQIQSLETRVVPADCYFKGRIDIEDVSIENNMGNLRYEFTNRLTNDSFQSSDQLPEGKYQVKVLDERNCVDTWDKDILITKDCLNDRPVFSPNNDYIDDTYYISETGKARVYDRSGKMVTEFEIPFYWDGTDSHGQKLPMGTYLIVINEKKVINITILK